MCQSFGTMGLAKAEAEINAHEQDSAYLLFLLKSNLLQLKRLLTLLKV